MAARGPAPQPTALKVLRGARVRNRREPKPAAGRPSMPADLGPEERAAWRELVNLLLRVPGLLTRADKLALELGARTLPPWRAVMAHVRTHGPTLTVHDAEGRVRFVQTSPEMTAAIKLGAQLKSLYESLGLTPSGRSRIALPAAPAVSELDRFLAGGRGA